MKHTVTITLTNDFHGTRRNIRVYDGIILSRAQLRRIKRDLCPSPNDCVCSGPLGTRGPQPDNARGWVWDYARGSQYNHGESTFIRWEPSTER